MKILSGCLCPVIMALSLVFVNLPAAAGDCAEAKRLYKQALEVDNLWNRLGLLNRSLAECESYEALYAKGEVLKRQHRWDDAAHAFRKAYSQQEPGLSGNLISAEQEQVAMGKAAEAYAKAGDGCHAYLSYRKAKSINPGKQPHWLNDSHEAFLQARSQRIVNTEEIQCVLGESKDFGVEEVKIELQNIEFNFDEAKLTKTAKDQVREIGEALTGGLIGYDSARIVGHADARGDWDYNMKLSQRRAKAVFDQLRNSHPELGSRLMTEGQGEVQLLVPNARTEDEHALNRRVEIILE